MQMRHTDEEIERAAARLEQLAEELDPPSAKVLTTDDLRDVAESAKAVRDDEARLREAVELARAQGSNRLRDRSAAIVFAHDHGLVGGTGQGR